ncbi:MAG: ATPase domain-containing protein [Candidatus Methanoperedens sp.]|nr:AAA family ATPase [Candidatus Methanoperedens sp.]MCZ7396816.1 AAA family ATPase [Candidatus Methanoperedens sp.]
MEAGVKLSTGISGLDEMLDGGINHGSIVAAVGPPGSGKTIFSLQFLHASLSSGRTCLYISANHRVEELMRYSQSYGWDFSQFITSKQLVLMQIPPVQLMQRGGEMHLVSEYLDELPRVVNEIKMEVVIIDSVTDFLMLCKSQFESRSRLLNLFTIISDNGSSALITAETDVNSDSSKYGIVEYAADGLIVLRRVQSADLSEIVPVIQVAKMRWSKHMREIRQYDFTDRGIVVYNRYNVMLSDMHG